MEIRNFFRLSLSWKWESGDLGVTMLPHKVLNISSVSGFKVVKQQSHLVAHQGSKWPPPIRREDGPVRTYIIFSWTLCSTLSQSLIWVPYECHPFLLEWSKAAGHKGNSGMRTQCCADGIAPTHRVWVIALTHNSKRVNWTKLTNWGEEEEVRFETINMFQIPTKKKRILILNG